MISWWPIDYTYLHYYLTSKYQASINFFLLIFNFYCQFEHYTKCHLEAVVYMATHRQVKIFKETYCLCICTRSCICFDEGRKLNVLVYFSHKRFIFKIKYSKVYLCFIHLDEAWIHLLPVWYTTDVPQLIWVLSKRASFDLLSGLLPRINIQ